MTWFKNANITPQPIFLNELRKQTLSFACVAFFQPRFISVLKGP